ncbi:mechanosensitive ion channel family protein [Alphaproteobacteria bacterium endosymbiont of Tiliacea citrago]|uniref:mechanosensitive ion channel family protein n=1 Tax=Alphaproteobacteria bacterium endosymbiont of Tiliacea citrago TaxID=3077944 RepID=UPI00313ED56A
MNFVFFVQDHLFLLFPLFCTFFVGARLLYKKSYDKFFIISFIQVLSIVLLFCFKHLFVFNFLLSFSCFLMFFIFLFFFFDLISDFLEVNVLFEIYLNFSFFICLIFFSFSKTWITFDLFYSILGLFIFAVLRSFYFYWKHCLDIKFKEYKVSSFLVKWSYFWGCSSLNFLFIILVLFFWDFDYLILLNLLKFLEANSFLRLLFGVFSFPYFIYFCDSTVDFIFYRMFSFSSSYSSRAKTFKSMLRWAIRIVFGFIYFSLIYVNLSTVSWNLSVLAGLASLGFKPVIDDFINGVCVLFEDSVNIGEFVHVADVSGIIEEVTLRVIKLRNFDGSLYVVPFRKVEVIKNRSKEFVYIVFDLILDTSVNSSKVIDWIADSYENFKNSKESSEFFHCVLEDLEIIGITSITAIGAVYESRLKIKPFNTRFIKACYLKSLKDLAEERGVNFGFEYAIFSESKKVEVKK